MRADGFDFYTCESDFVFHVDMELLAKVLRRRRKNHMVTLSATGARPEKLSIRFENSTRTYVAEYVINLLKIEDDGFEPVEIPDMDYPAIMTVFK